jgi:hypothetical protein
VITYAAVELYNFKLLDEDGPWDLSNLAMLHTFSGYYHFSETLLSYFFFLTFYYCRWYG